jgi:hypothetical protein
MQVRDDVSREEAEARCTTQECLMRARAKAPQTQAVVGSRLGCLRPGYTCRSERKLPRGGGGGEW